MEQQDNINYKNLYNLLINQIMQAHNALIEAQTEVLEKDSAIDIAEKLLRMAIELHCESFKNKLDTRMKTFYDYLDEIGFEEQIKDKGRLYRKIKSIENNSLFSDFNLQQSYFSIAHQLYLTIYNDIHDIKYQLHKEGE